MKKKIAVILSGCGVMDGSEIHEAVLTLLALDKQGADYQCFAPNRMQHHVINHYTKQESQESRNVLVESARIARGDILDLKDAKASDFDGAVLPGGFGAAKNLSDFAFKNTEMTVQEDVVHFIQSMHQANKPVAFICIAPAMIPKLYPKGTMLTIGNDTQTAKALETMGGVHVQCTVHDIVVDKKNKVISTPAYMLAKSISEAAMGIEKGVASLLELA